MSTSIQIQNPCNTMTAGQGCWADAGLMLVVIPAFDGTNKVEGCLETTFE